MLTEGNKRCARCSMVVLDVFNAMMQELMHYQRIPAPALYDMIMDDRHFRLKKLSRDELQAVQTLQNQGFSQLDSSIIYKIVVYFKGFISPPTRNWGSNPQPHEIGKGDDVERIRIKRNKFVHKFDAEITDEEMTDFFVTSIEIGRRMDIILDKAGHGGHEQTIKDYQSCFMQPEITEHYLQALQQIESLQRQITAQVGDKEMHFYFGRSIAHVIATLKDSVNGDSMTAVKLYFYDIEDGDELLEQLNKLGVENNLNTDNVKFIRSTKECIVVSVLIRNKVLVNSYRLHSEVSLFVQKIVSSTGMMFSSEKKMNIVVVSSEEDADEGRQCISDVSVEDFACKEPESKKRKVGIHQGNKKGRNAMILDLKIRNKVFQSTELIKENFVRFLGNIDEEMKGRVFSRQKDGPLNVVLSVNDYGCSKKPKFSGVNDENELRLVIIGKTGTGKSATGNSILGGREFKSQSTGASVTNKCQLGITTRFNRKLVVVDTPGLHDTEITNEKVTREIVKCIGMTAPGPHAILLTVNVGRFTKEEQETVQHFVNHFGDGIYNYLLVVFTRADDLEDENTDINDYVKNCPESLKTILNLCDHRYIPFNNKRSGNSQEQQVKDLIGSVDEIVRKNGGVCYTDEMFKEAEKTLLRREEEVARKLKEEEQKKVETIKSYFQTECDKKSAVANEEKVRLEAEIKQTNKEHIDQIAQLKKQMEDNDRRREQQMEKLKKEIERKVRKVEESKRVELEMIRDALRIKIVEEEDLLSQIVNSVAATAKRAFQTVKESCSIM